MAVMTAVACILSLMALWTLAEARIPGVYSGGPWQSAHATFYGGSDASGTMGTVFPSHCPSSSSLQKSKTSLASALYLALFSSP